MSDLWGLGVARNASRGCGPVQTVIGETTPVDWAARLREPRRRAYTAAAMPPLVCFKNTSTVAVIGLAQMQRPPRSGNC